MTYDCSYSSFIWLFNFFLSFFPCSVCIGKQQPCIKYCESHQERAETEARTTQGRVCLVLFCSHPALPQQKQDQIWYAKGSVAFSQRPQGSCLLLLYLVRYNGCWIIQCCSSSISRGRSPCKVLTGAASEAKAVRSQGAVRWKPSRCWGGFHSFRWEIPNRGIVLNAAY